MHVRELIDILSEQPPDAEVELAVIAPVDEDPTTSPSTATRSTACCRGTTTTTRAWSSG